MTSVENTELDGENPVLTITREFDAPERLAYAHGAGDGDPGQFQVTVAFAALAEGKTRLEMQMRFATVEERDTILKECGALDGANQTMARLENFLKEDGP